LIRPLPERLPDLQEHAVPSSPAEPAEQRKLGYQGLFLAVQEPSPIRGEGQHCPDRSAERAGEMHHRGIDRDDQVEIGDHRGGVAEITELIGKIGNHADRKPRDIAGALADLEAEPADPGDFQDRQQPLDRDRAVAVVPCATGCRPRRCRP